jgi:hypothetical protein
VLLRLVRRACAGRAGRTREQPGPASRSRPKGRSGLRRKGKRFSFYFSTKKPPNSNFDMKITFLERCAKTKVVLNFEMYNLVKKNKTKISIVLKIEV